MIFLKKSDVRAGYIYHHGVYEDISEIRKKLYKYEKISLCDLYTKKYK